MPLEIERRFLVTSDRWKKDVSWQASLQQGYLHQSQAGLTIRVRLQQQANQEIGSWLTIKAMPHGTAPAHTRLEFEYPIPPDHAEELLRHCAWRVEKRRYGLLLPDGDWIVDVFSGENLPLVIAEVELQEPETKLGIPRWCGREVTGVHQLSNAALARHPWQRWSPKERVDLGLEDGSGNFLLAPEI